MTRFGPDPLAFEAVYREPGEFLSRVAPMPATLACIERVESA